MLLREDRTDRSCASNKESAPSLIDLFNNFQKKHKIEDYAGGILIPIQDYANRLAKSNLPAPFKQFFYIRHTNLFQRKKGKEDGLDKGNLLANLWRDHVKRVILYDWEVRFDTSASTG